MRQQTFKTNSLPSWPHAAESLRFDAKGTGAIDQAWRGEESKP
jgi:hypothetical protein